jgi:hypothetical protein
MTTVAHLVTGKWSTELLTVHGVLASGFKAELGSSENTPGDTEAGIVEAAEGALEAGNVGEEVVLGHLDLIHENHTGLGGPQTELSLRAQDVSTSDRIRRFRIGTSIAGAVRPFIPFSRMNPRMVSVSSFAQTTNTSATGELVIQVLAPDRT